jgi:Mannitol-1-phosphate/altronate dehydrogenases
VHLGLGAFFRAHQAWYTERAPDRAQWGIAAFTGRSARLARELSAQDCLYTLIVRGRDRDDLSVVSSISSAHDAADSAAWQRLLAAPHTSIVSLTVTEAAYLRGPSGGLDLGHDDVQTDLASWRAGNLGRVRTVPARLAAGFAGRAAAGAGAITLLSCDNLPANGTAALRVVAEFAEAADAGLAEWMQANVRAVDTLVDRITPATTPTDITEVRQRSGYHDSVPVVTEPYAEWVLSDSFAAARPDWPTAGALITDDVTPYEQRKLRLLNGAHSLLAYAAPLRGHGTVADAMGDPVVVQWVRAWWAQATPSIALPPAETQAYCDALAERFGNARIQHRLAQIAADGSQKLPVRVLPVLRAERRAGRIPSAAVRVLGAWIAHLRGHGVPVTDPALGDRLSRIRTGRDPDAVRGALAVLDHALLDDDELVAAVTEMSVQCQQTPT